MQEHQSAAGIEQENKKQLLSYFSLVISGFIVIFLVIDFFLGRYFMASVLSGLAIITLTNFIIFQRRGTTPVAGYLITFPYIIFAFLVFIDGGVGKTGYLWGFFVPFFAFYIHGAKAGGWISSLYLMFLWGLYFLFTSRGVDMPYPLETVGTSSSAYIAMSIFLMAFERSRNQTTREIYRLHKKLEELSTTDDLTGALNRRALISSINHELHRFYRNRSPVSLLLLDLDYFKKVNDQYGHIRGDEVLVHISNLVENNLRNLDIWSRYGGEEFCVLLPDTTLLEAAAMAERIRKLIKSRPLGEIQCTVSIGVADCQAGDTPEQLLERADIGLYQAKREGRDRVCLSKECLE